MSVYFLPYIVQWDLYKEAIEHINDHDKFLENFVCLDLFFDSNSHKDSNLIKEYWEEGIKTSGIDVPAVGFFIDKVFWSWTRGKQTLDIELPAGELWIDFVMSPTSVSNLVEPIMNSSTRKVRDIFNACDDPIQSGFRYEHLMEWIRFFHMAYYNKMGIANYLR